MYILSNLDLQIPGWKINTYGDSNNYKPLAKEGTVNYGFIAIKSNIWKGWTLVYHNKKYTSLYVGAGFKSSNLGYFPSSPEEILTERKDVREQPEPNFIEEVKK